MIHVMIQGQSLGFKTDPALFSPDRIDQGTLAMLSKVEFGKEDKVLDLGCGYGVVGIYAAKIVGPERVVMVDVHKAAVDAAEENIEINQVPGIKVYCSDGFKDFKETGFSVILSNPPYHVDFAVPKHFIEKGFNRLELGGRMYLVTKRKDWYKQKMIAIFGGVQIYEEQGYYVFKSIKKSSSYAHKSHKHESSKCKSRRNEFKENK
ncbi:class I SAM-dependent methyltransferase [Paenibacillus sp. J2TS4]|uniref:class I SAM-dependent methyltransferase n=1 Tax=Paenibacillus sp. J2TS4 TaxID=2807194 RepID=UPI001B19F939|nr:methyltransferase [Paenibacillus sp. J2TS4]GIP32253.1 16S rRNA methyltransferase [Paenibacillus sp. J2TS4]